MSHIRKINFRKNLLCIYYIFICVLSLKYII
jgi:hypothetical protein